MNSDLLDRFLQDSGLSSRKLWLAIGCLVLLCAFVAVAAKFASIQGMFPEFIGGVLGVFSIYCGASAANKWSTAKHVVANLAGDSTKPASSSEDIVSKPPVEPEPQ